MRKIGELLRQSSNARAKNLSTEFQVYGSFIAEALGDLKHCSLYIKLAKTHERNLLEQALNFAKGYTAAKSKGKVFMWRLKQLKDAKRATQAPE
ncbi:MAG: hypothetical protein Q7S88_03585 [Candidatus Daviesbacteria bacterium]|nr:hypothetical protein [Candidatus Daviesbacteria bacterium]